MCNEATIILVQTHESAAERTPSISLECTQNFTLVLVYDSCQKKGKFRISLPIGHYLGAWKQPQLVVT